MAEAVNLKAIMYYNFCRYDRAEEAVAEFRATYPELIDELRKVAKKEEQDNAEFFHYVQKVRAGSAGLSLRVSQLAQSALQDKTLEKTFAWVDELERELKQHDKADRAWKTTSISGEVLQELSVQKSLAEAEAGRLARERLERLVAELIEKRSDASKIKIETLKAKLGQKKAEMQKMEVFGQNKEEAIVIDDEHFMWSFNGEYWKDELGFYRYRISSRCKRGAGGVAGK